MLCSWMDDKNVEDLQVFMSLRQLCDCRVGCLRIKILCIDKITPHSLNLGSITSVAGHAFYTWAFTGVIPELTHLFIQSL